MRLIRIDDVLPLALQVALVDAATKIGHVNVTVPSIELQAKCLVEMLGENLRLLRRSLRQKAKGIWCEMQYTMMILLNQAGRHDERPAATRLHMCARDNKEGKGAHDQESNQQPMRGRLGAKLVTRATHAEALKRRGTAEQRQIFRPLTCARASLPIGRQKRKALLD